MRALVLAALPCLAALPAAGTGLPLVCVFDTLCTDTDPCETPTEPAAVRVEATPDGARMGIDGDTLPVTFLSPEGREPFTVFVAEAEDSASVMLSVFEDGHAAMTLHAMIFQPFVATAHGRCETPK